MSDDTLAALRKKIELMRELGVTEADGIKLGPPIAKPKDEESPKEMLARANEEALRKHNIMFAASSTKPKLLRVK